MNDVVFSDKATFHIMDVSIDTMLEFGALNSQDPHEIFEEERCSPTGQRLMGLV